MIADYAAGTKILETSFSVELLHAIRAKSFHEKGSFREQADHILGPAIALLPKYRLSLM